MISMGIEDILMHDESLFQNINAFDPDYVPPNYNYRDRQMEAMAMAIRPAISGGQLIKFRCFRFMCNRKQQLSEKYLN